MAPIAGGVAALASDGSAFASASVAPSLASRMGDGAVGVDPVVPLSPGAAASAVLLAGIASAVRWKVGVFGGPT